MIQNNMDPTQLFKENRPYSATSGKYFIYPNHMLAYDPYGYYSGKRMIGER